MIVLDPTLDTTLSVSVMATTKTLKISVSSVRIATKCWFQPKHLTRRNNHDRIQAMSKDELQKLIYCIYLRGHLNEQRGIDDAHFFEHLMNLDARHVDNIIDAMDNLTLYHIRIYSFDGEPPIYMNCKFFGVGDAGKHLTSTIRNIYKVDDTTYTTTTNVYRIIPCNERR